VRNHLSLLSSLAFISQVSGTCTYLGVVLDNHKRRLSKAFPSVRNFTLHIQCLWKESKSSERDFLFKSEAVASKFPRGDTWVFLSLGGEERTKALEFILLLRGEERTEAPSILSAPKGDEKGQSPKYSEAARPDHGLLYTKLPAGFQASSLAQKSSRVAFKWPFKLRPLYQKFSGS